MRDLAMLAIGLVFGIVFGYLFALWEFWSDRKAGEGE